jgi:hypothetical protein
MLKAGRFGKEEDFPGRRLCSGHGREPKERRNKGDESDHWNENFHVIVHFL